ncbi:hypothetical protein KFL_004280080 [Klebsormidium nitens]|uniref:Uncharacterized protein n=1 Tax=Klebsormidium nitens TaxID=105231 RepID=A0A1Y1IJW5_KLENI|nr:hypothetical protein KFL_004280080 [Klebsormidium nitens]|eukprot:GAQ88438.1 hypothetical protein KFL_004280080 [Klebsormidium nitens]
MLTQLKTKFHFKQLRSMESAIGQQRVLADGDQTDAPLEILKQEKCRLENAVVHLKDSNVQLEEALRESGPDEEYTTAVSENKVVIRELEQKIKQLEEDIRLATQLLECEMEDVGSKPENSSDARSNGTWL